MPEIIIKNEVELNAMRCACRLASQTLVEVAHLVKVGENTKSLDEFVYQYTIDHGGVPATLGYRGFPASCCTSVNDVICHGIPSRKVVLRDGDIVNVDITSILDGWHGDLSATFYVGEPKPETIRLVETTRESLYVGIGVVKEGARIGDIGAAIQSFVEGRGFSVVRDYVGHGIGRQFHEDLAIPHYGRRGMGLRLKKGMTFTIEPMVNEGDWREKKDGDGWTSRTRDGGWSAQFEHTILVKEDGCEILTQYETPLKHSEIRPYPNP